MNRPAPDRFPSAFTRFATLVTLRDRIAGLFRPRPPAPPAPSE